MPDVFSPYTRSLAPKDRGWWLRNLRGHETSIGWPQPAEREAESAPARGRSPSALKAV
jgi:hypothetical protein